MNETTLLDIKSAYVFNKVFGAEQNKELLISLINSILQGDLTITDVKVSDVIRSRFSEFDVRLDIQAKSNDNKLINMKMHARRNCCQAEVLGQVAGYLFSSPEFGKGSEDPLGTGIWITNTDDMTNQTNAVSNSCLGIQTYGEDIINKFRVFYVELPKFHSSHIDSMLDIWLTFFKNPVDEKIKDVAEVQQALQTLREISSDPKQREIYENYEKYLSYCL